MFTHCIFDENHNELTHYIGKNCKKQDIFMGLNMVNVKEEKIN